MTKPIQLMHPDGHVDIVNPGQTKTIGRSRGCDISALESHVSGSHATISYERNKTAYVWDNGSTNGTYIQRGHETIKVIEKTQLFVGDIIYLSNRYHLTLEGSIDTIAKESEEQRLRRRDTEVIDPKEVDTQ